MFYMYEYFRTLAKFISMVKASLMKVSIRAFFVALSIVILESLMRKLANRLMKVFMSFLYWKTKMVKFTNFSILFMRKVSVTIFLLYFVGCTFIQYQLFRWKVPCSNTSTSTSQSSPTETIDRDGRMDNFTSFLEYWERCLKTNTSITLLLQSYQSVVTRNV